MDYIDNARIEELRIQASGMSQIRQLITEPCKSTCDRMAVITWHLDERMHAVKREIASRRPARDKRPRGKGADCSGNADAVRCESRGGEARTKILKRQWHIASDACLD